MDEVHEFCRRVLGPGATAIEAAEEALAAPSAGRVALLSSAGRACRARAAIGEASAGDASQVQEAGQDPPGLAAAVASELAHASARLPERQREVLALRELLGLPYDEIAQVMRIESMAVAPLLARARLKLRAELRGPAPEAPACEERDLALRALARRQDSEPMSDADRRWVLDHAAGCVQCSQAHAAMLEASACYRAWSPEAPIAPVVPAEPGASARSAK